MSDDLPISPFAERDTWRCDMRYGYEDQDGINGIRNTRKHSDGRSVLGMVWEVQCTILYIALTFVHWPRPARGRKVVGATGQGLGLALGYRIWNILLLPVSKHFPWDFRYILSACAVLII
jgi:hypothetical protein